MATRFRLYSTDIAPTLAPDFAGPSPELNIAWDHDPIEGGIQETPPEGRGSVIETGNLGTVFHDLGVPVAGGTLAVVGNASDGEWLTPETIAMFRTAYHVADAEYFFTDGIRCWRVRWQRRPAGFRVWMNQFWAQYGKVEYSYEFTFLVVEQVL